MTTALLRPQPLPLEGMRPGVGLLVLALHVGLLWVANLYWPLQSFLLGSVQDAAQSITVQILRKKTEVNSSVDIPVLNTSSQAISNPGRQRFGRAEAMLELPGAQFEASTPLAATLQAVQTARATQNMPERPAVVVVPAYADQAKQNIAPPAVPAPQTVAAPEPQPTTVRTADERLPAVAATALQPPPALVAPPAPIAPVATTLPVAAAAPLAAPVASVPASPAAVAAVPVISPSTAAVSTVSSPGNVTASGGSLAAGTGTAVPGVVSTAVPSVPPAVAPVAGAPLDLSLPPPRHVYRPPIALPRRSLSEMANDQLRRKPRDALVEGMESAGNIDCLKYTPDGPVQGLLAIGPLLKRAFEEKCRK